jgi:alpha-beta hydrolase superfamily lysophospholipase
MAGDTTASGATTVRHTSRQFEGFAGARMHLQSWLPATDPAAVVAVVHGYGEHGGRYDRLAAALTPKGYAVYAYDLRGHGQSTGERGQVRRFGEYLNDTALFLDVVRAAQPGRPLFLLGHSLGGLIAATFAMRYPDGLGGLILSSPFLRLVMEVPATQRIGVIILSAVKPGFNIGNTVQAADLSHDQSVADAYVTDPLVHHVAPARWATEMLKAQGAALSAAPSLRLPLLLLYSDTDAIADSAASLEFFASAGSEDKKLHCYSGLYHELFNEVDNAAVFADLLAWLEGHGPEAAAPAGPA